MALQKQPVTFNFTQGLDSKTDPNQIPLGKFAKLQNTIFGTPGLLQKRNGFPQISSLPNATYTYLTTFNGNLTAVGAQLSALSNSSETWVTKGKLEPVALNTLPLIRSNTNQSFADIAVSASGLVCTVFVDNVPVAGTPLQYLKYAIADSTTGQNIVPPTQIVSNGTPIYAPKVFLLGNYFVIVFASQISSAYHLQYIAISVTNPLNVTTYTDISTSLGASSTGSFDGVVANNNLYLAYNLASSGGVQVRFINQALTLFSPATLSTYQATHVSVCADVTQSTPVIWVTSYNSGTSVGYSVALNQNLVTILSYQNTIPASTAVSNITSSAQNMVLTYFYEVVNTYAYDTSIQTNYIKTNTLTQAGTLGTASVLLRSVGLATKSFIVSGNIYVLVAYDGKSSSAAAFQPTYFLSDVNGNVIGKLAYSNGGGYSVVGLPSVYVSQAQAQLPYLYKDLITSVNKAQGAASVAGIYSQTGVNLATFNFTTANVNTAETGQNLHLSGGFLYMYDGYYPVEHGFHLWPDSVEVTTATTGGHLTAQQYYYQAVYEWSDNQGNIHRSAPSIPVTITTTGSTSTNTINVPTLRLTAKTANAVKVVLYRWSANQQNYYQVTSVSGPILNSLTVDYVTIADTLADSSIIGNSLIYTTGGVVENIAAPSCSGLDLFDTRLWLIDAEDQDLLWLSKQVIEGVPAEFSDLLTFYVAPATGAQGATGGIKCLAPMDDKQIVFKSNAIYYFNGTGPDNTGANSQYSSPALVTGTVGCSNQNSIVFIPDGLMFQSDKGIWLLGRNLTTEYVGEPVEAYNGYTVQSALTIPGTNQVRFVLSGGVTLCYDYVEKQWSTFTNLQAVSSTLFQGLQAYINSKGQVFQESPGTYLDGSQPTLMTVTTGWVNAAGLQGFERIYDMYILGNYQSPHKLSVEIAYDYNPSPSQVTVISPANYSSTFGSDPLYGSGQAFGGSSSVEQWRIFMQRQKCEAFQLTIREIFDPTYGTIAGGGLTLSGVSLTVGVKGSRPKLPASQTAG